MGSIEKKVLEEGIECWGRQGKDAEEGKITFGKMRELGTI